MMMKEKEIRILFSYHRYDIEWRDLFANGLKPFQEHGQLEVIYGEIIKPSQIFPNMQTNDPGSKLYDFIILLISKKYLSLNDVIEKEIPEKILPLQERGTRVIPVYIEDCSWQSINWLREMNVWPSHQLPFSNMSENERKQMVSRFIKDELKLGGSEKAKSAYGEGEYGEGQYSGKDGKEETEQTIESEDEGRFEQEVVKLEERYKLKFSLETKNIIKVAMQLAVHEAIDTWKLHTRETLIAIAYFGQRTERKYNTAQFVLEKLRSNRSNYLEFYFNRIESEKSIDQKTQGKLLNPTGYVRDAIRTAKRFAISTTNNNLIHIRHLFAGLLFFRAAGRATRSAQVLIEKAEIELPTFIIEFQQYVKNTFKEDNIEAWGKIFGEPKREAEDQKLTISDFKNGLDFEGSEICDKVITIAVRFNGLDLYFTHKSYVNFELKSVNSVAAQLHRYGENEAKIALVVVGPKKGIKVSEPKMTGFVTKGEIAKLSGYKKGPPGELAWLNGNLRVQGTREKAGVYVINSEILENPEASKEVHELLKLAKEYVESKGPVELERKKSDSEMDDEPGGEAGEISQRIPGVSNDNVVDDDGPLVDRLGIEGEVNALSAMIAAKGTEPPLSIGLFGDWGSGKSFFMGKMRQRITAIAEESEKCVRNNEGSYFCQNIVQIPFNAWHYMDANLWASLVTHIFDKLAEHLGGDEKQAVEEKKKELVKKVKSAQEMLESAKEKEDEANEALESAKGELETSEGKVAERRKSVSQLTPRAMAVSVMKNEKIVARVDGAASLLGLKDMPKTIGELEKTINDCRQIGVRAHRFWDSLGQSKGQKFVWALLLIALTVVPGFIIWKICSGMNGEFQLVGTIISGIGGFVVWIRPKLKAINEGFGELEAARDAAYAEMNKSYNKETESLREEVVVAERVCDAAREKVEQAEERLSRAKKDREEIETGKRLHDYIMERSNDSKYKNKLGIVSMIRDDFKGLSELVTESRKDDTPGELRKIERIVLYIDDLDRCPSDRVVEVLQAIHLILAFKLFIVVVGVDCRWILHALRKEYSAFGGGDGKFEGSGGRWLTTPHNYVEKIFQIPFALEQMEDDGYRELVTGLTDVKEQAQAEEERGEDMESPKIDEGERQIENPEESEADKDKKVQGDEVSSGGKDDKPDDDDKDKAGQEEESDEKRVNEGIGKMNMTPDELLLEEWEIEFMKELGDFVSSPRAAKRFVNIYMLICATLTDGERLAKFKGTKDGGGDYQAVQLMLGILTGFPNQACDLLKAIRDNAKEEKDIREFLKKLKMRKVPKSAPAVYKNIAKSEISETERGTWERLHKVLEDKITKLGINNSFKPFGDWAGLVGRFSFQYGRASELQADENEEEEKKMAAK